MATGPHSSDTVQRYLRRINENMSFDEVPETRHREIFNGEVDWDTGDVDLSDIDFVENGEIQSYLPDTGLKALDNVYHAVKTTQNGNHKLEGLRTYRIPWDAPIDTESRSWSLWVDDYSEAGLIDSPEDPDQADITPEGEIFLDIDPSDYDTENVGVEDVGDFYRTMTSQNGGEPDGSNIEAFLLYGSGISHTQVGDLLNMPESTARSTANILQDMGLLDENYGFTGDGAAFGEMVMDQVDALEEATEARVNDEYDSWEALKPEGYVGNGYMAKSLKDSNI